MKSKIVRDMTLISLFAALIAVTSFIAIPIGTLPITLQTFGVFSTLILLGGRRGSISVAVYIALGAVGLPVFSGFSGGIGRLFDANGGFIFGFLAAALVYWLLSRVFSDTSVGAVISTVSAHLVLYAVGALWLFFGYSEGAGFPETLALTVLPYLLPDAVKLFLAIFLCEKIKKRLNKPL
jgi:biotin transport system substrate-specific component